LPGFVEPEVPVGPLGLPLDVPPLLLVPPVLLVPLLVPPVLSAGGAVPLWPRCWAAVPRFRGESLGGVLPLGSALPVFDVLAERPLPVIAPLAPAN